MILYSRTGKLMRILIVVVWQNKLQISHLHLPILNKVLAVTKFNTSKVYWNNSERLEFESGGCGRGTGDRIPFVSQFQIFRQNNNQWEGD